jgi:hypothetical protein
MLVEERVSELERAMMQLVYQSRQTEISIFQLSEEMRDFKDEMRVFKDEMRDFKDEMRVFKDEMRNFRDEMNRKWGDLVRKMGTFVEDIVLPGLPLLLKKSFDLDVDDMSIRRKIKDADKNIWEFDAVATSGDYAFLVDVKGNYGRQKDLEYFKDVLLPKACELLPELKDKKTIGCIASFNLDQSIVNVATEHNLFALAMGGDYLVLLNEKELKEKDILPS